jgi:DNA polymerase V
LYRELNGQRCIPMEYDRPDKEGISTARSFGTMETELAPMEEALATYVANAALKLRTQKSVCAAMFIFCHTSRFAVVQDLYSAGLAVQIHTPTNDTAMLIKEALAALRKIYRKGPRYQKVGVELRDLRPDTQVQASLFDPVDTVKETKLQKALKVIDQLNRNYGKDTIRYAAMGFEKKWFMRQEFLSKKYTTRIEDVIVVKAR